MKYVSTEKLKKYRTEKGLTQSQMADILGYAGKSGYNNLESGLTAVSLEKAFQIAEIFGKTVEDIFLSTSSID